MDWRRIAGAAFAALAACMLPATSPAAAPDDYPTRAITLVVAYPPGGPTDVAARLFAARLGEALGQSVVVDNRVGAAGRIGTDYVAKAKPDGYTLLLANSATHGLLATSTLPLPYDPLRSFTPIAPLFQYTAVLVCNPRIPAKTLPELVAYGKSKPRGLVFGIPGVGTGSHFAGDALAAEFKVPLLNVPYKGSAPTLQAVIAGEVDCAFDGGARAQLAAGTVRGIAVTSLKRDPGYPDLPTLDELGMKGFEITTWQALMAPPNLPPPIAKRLSAATREVLAQPDFEARMREHSLVLIGGDAQDLARMIDTEIRKFRVLARQLNIQFE